MAVLSDLEPQKVFYYFEEISKIPRGSYHEKEISDYLVGFAKNHGLEYWQDALYNVVMKVPASAGREMEDALIFQGHMDMVCEKNADCTIDMEKEGLVLATEGDYVFAKGTTLGGDDGIAVAYMLAIADDSSISHPPLEYIITVSEEVGMEGANAIDLSMLTGNRMLNLDSEEEGVFLSSCAGGLSLQTKLPVQWETAQDASVWCELQVTGLLGGHSGCEIDKERGNANKIIGRVLYEIGQEVTFSIAALEGGQKDNAIPLRSGALLGILKEEKAALETACKRMNTILKTEFVKSDPDVTVELHWNVKEQGMVLNQESCQKVISLLMCLPNGVCNMSVAVPGLVETSLNLGIMKLEKDHLYLQHAVRSSVTTRKHQIASVVEVLVHSFGGSVKRQGEYPAWEYKEESVVRPKVIALYEKMYGKRPVVEGIHAGLECGILAGKIPNLDCIAMGPDILDIHTPMERLSISSTKRMYEFLISYMEQ